MTTTAGQPADRTKETLPMAEKPVPEPTPEARFFWERAKAGELWIQRCSTTGKAFFYPRTYSPFVRGGPVEWFHATGNASLYSYIIDHRPPPGFGPGPNPIAVVELAEGPRMMTSLVGVEPVPEALSLDMSLQVDFEPRGEWAVPVFRPVVKEPSHEAR
jgi:uncharacterized OB-fold protein